MLDMESGIFYGAISLFWFKSKMVNGKLLLCFVQLLSPDEQFFFAKLAYEIFLKWKAERKLIINKNLKCQLI